MDILSPIINIFTIWNHMQLKKHESLPISYSSINTYIENRVARETECAIARREKFKKDLIEALCIAHGVANNANG